MKLRSLLIRCTVLGLLLLCLGTILNPGYTTYAVETTGNNKGSGVVIQAEETEWRYRVIDGKLQRRLWSITYGRWLTDWEWV